MSKITSSDVSYESEPHDETAYFLFSEANRAKLLGTIERSENPNSLVVITLEEWNKKYCPSEEGISTIQTSNC
ncbi:hypothetical protein [Phormidesmis priestleyi]|uniref:hypothetical protein n=1 Tax=Phormidesmis priestleyi TaxID=268141 RepID=UPI0012E90B91|nr:hypothetical protein [Phormidesmis priestleyi]